VFEPPHLWQTRIDAAFRDRAPRIERVGGGDQMVSGDQILSGIGLISNAGARFEALRPSPPRGRFEANFELLHPAWHRRDIREQLVRTVRLNFTDRR
jgi:hypothetical protein